MTSAFRAQKTNMVLGPFKFCEGQKKGSFARYPENPNLDDLLKQLSIRHASVLTRVWKEQAQQFCKEKRFF